MINSMTNNQLLFVKYILFRESNTSSLMSKKLSPKLALNIPGRDLARILSYSKKYGKKRQSVKIWRVQNKI